VFGAGCRVAEAGGIEVLIDLGAFAAVRRQDGIPYSNEVHRGTRYAGQRVAGRVK